VLDLGANTGEFSELAAAGARVKAVDIDELAVSGIAERARTGNLDIHPLVGNLTQPTPAEGWRNRETRSLIERLTLDSDLVLVLALMHHLRITGGIPFDEIVALLADLTRRHVVFEIVPPSDTMFAAMARGREPLYGDCESRAPNRHWRRGSRSGAAWSWKTAASCCCSRSAERYSISSFWIL
jgi:SAM-dependent methyltransferase